MVDYEYILLCYNEMRKGKNIRVNRERIEKSKRILSSKPKEDFTFDDKIAVYRISFIESNL